MIPHILLPICLAQMVLALFLLLVGTLPAKAQVTLLIPGQPNIEKNLPPKAETADKDQAKKTQKNQQNTVGQPLPPDSGPATPETDLLITMMHPFAHKALPLDMPQIFTVLRHDAATPVVEGKRQPERRDLLGDLEEINYLGQKAWGANVALDKPGLYQFIIEARPWWDEQGQRFIQQDVKVILPVHGIEDGWDEPAGQKFEIVPRTRPFGLSAPAMFAGQVLRAGTPLPNARMVFARINTDGQKMPSPWHEQMVARSDGNGQFAFVANAPGWWCCMATHAGDPLKGADGQAKELECGAIFWFYVDAMPAKDDKR